MKNFKIEQIRSILFDTKQLDTIRKSAREELIRRTTKYTIDDVLRRLAQIKRSANKSTSR